MPTHDLAAALDDQQARHSLDAAATGSPGRAGLGIEAEVFAFDRGSPTRRTPIHGTGGSLAALTDPATPARLMPAPDAAAGEAGWRCGGADGDRISFEPGGQIEVSTCYAHAPGPALDRASELLATMADTLMARGIRLVSSGIDVWHPGTAPQQLSGPRYPAMADSLDARGPAGRTMMRDTCALQLNLDLDVGEEAASRWLVTTMLAPIATATFACSPSSDGRVRSSRSRAWQALDPTRTGFVDDLLQSGGSLADRLERFAMDADVLFVVDEGAGTSVPPGWRFRDWMRHGHPRFGWPTVDDLDLHLTTLFPEVRPRGYLEVRSIDALPARCRQAVATLVVGAVYDPTARDRILDVVTARDRILDVVTARAVSLDEQLRHAATRGLADAAWCATAVEVWSYAREGAARLVDSGLHPAALRTAERFLDRFTLRGRCPADELLETLRRDGADEAMTWAAEPSTTDLPAHQAVPR